MAISVLGPLEVDRLRPRDRVVLAALASRRGAVVTADELSEACWGARPPDTWWQQVKTSVAAIRAELGPDAVRTDMGGYGFGLDPGTLDSVRFEREVETGREHAIRARPDRAVATFRRALDLWRGAPFGELGDWPPARVEAMRLAEIRSTVEEELLEARLAAGEAASAVADAERLTREQPLREARWAILALAEYRADRQADALAVLREARARLIDDLGVEPGTRLSSLEVAILRQDPVLDRPAPIAAPRADCPYPGLQAFDSSAAERFFGREPEIEAVLGRIHPGRVIAIVGPSGSGKSSLLLGGVLPAVAAGARTAESLRLEVGVVTQVASLRRRSVRPDILAIDQFEELFLLDGDAIDAVCACLGQLVGDGTTLLLTLRSDFLDRATALPHIGTGLGGGVFALGPMGRDGLRQAVEQPAIAAGLRIEPGLVELILRDADGRPTALPHLSHALVETWRRRDGATMTVDGYETSGGIAGAIANSAEERFQLLSAEEQQSCRSLLMRLLERDEEGGVVRRRIALAVLLGDARRGRVIEQLVASRLLAVDGDTLLVAHEAVARAWPRLAGWLTADADSALELRRVEDGAGAWDRAGRGDDDLPRGARLEASLEWRDQSAPELTPTESDFLAAAAALRRSEVDEIAARAATQRRQNRRLRLALGSVAALLVIALCVGAFAVLRERDAVAAQGDARTEALAAIATSLVGSDRDAGALLAAELYRRNPSDVRARSALMALLTASGTPDRKIFFSNAQRIFAAPIPGTDRVLVAADDIARSEDGKGLRLSIWDLGAGRLVRRLPVRLPDAVTYFTGGLHVSADGVAVVAYATWKTPQDCCGSILATVDIEKGRLLAGPVQLPYEVADRGAFSPDGKTLALRTYDSAVPVWIDVATLKATRGAFRADTSDGAAIDLIDGGRIAVAAQGRINRFDARTRAFVDSVHLPADLASNDLVALGDGTAIVAGPAGTARVDLGDGHVLWRAGTTDGSGPEDDYCDRIMVLRERGTFLCSASETWEARIADGVRTKRTFPAQAEWIGQAGLVDGALMVVNQRTTPFIERFPVDDTGPISTVVAPHRAMVGGFADRSTIVVGSMDSTPDTGGQYLWDIANRRQLGPTSDFVDALGDGVIVRYTTKTDDQELSRIGSTTEWSLRGGRFDGSSVLPREGATADRAFAISDDWIQAFDPPTGRAVGKPLDFTGKELKNYWVMVHDQPGSDRALVTWWDVDAANLRTAVFDLRSGKELVRGLAGDVASTLLPDGDVVSTTSSELHRSTPDLEPVDSLPKPRAGANHFELSRDGATLLLQGLGQPAVLYDLPSGKKLGGDIPTYSPNWDSAHLSADGRTLMTNAASGVLRWDLGPHSMAMAACRMAGRSLSATEWRGYFGAETQVDTCRML